MATLTSFALDQADFSQHSTGCSTVSQEAKPTRAAERLEIFRHCSKCVIIGVMLTSAYAHCSCLTQMLARYASLSTGLNNYLVDITMKGPASLSSYSRIARY